MEKPAHGYGSTLTVFRSNFVEILDRGPQLIVSQWPEGYLVADNATSAPWRGWQCSHYVRLTILILRLTTFYGHRQFHRNLLNLLYPQYGTHNVRPSHVCCKLVSASSCSWFPTRHVARVVSTLEVIARKNFNISSAWCTWTVEVAIPIFFCFPLLVTSGVRAGCKVRCSHILQFRRFSHTVVLWSLIPGGHGNLKTQSILYFMIYHSVL